MQGKWQNVKWDEKTICQIASRGGPYVVRRKCCADPLKQRAGYSLNCSALKSENFEVGEGVTGFKGWPLCGGPHERKRGVMLLRRPEECWHVRWGISQGKFRVLGDVDLPYEHIHSLPVDIIAKSPNALWADSLPFTPLALRGHPARALLPSGFLWVWPIGSFGFGQWKASICTWSGYQREGGSDAGDIYFCTSHFCFALGWPLLALKNHMILWGFFTPCSYLCKISPY